MRVLIKGAGDLATGVAAVLKNAGYQIVMTEIEKPLTVRRQVAFSSAVYQNEMVVEGIKACLAISEEDIPGILEEGNIAVIVDPEAKIRNFYHPDVIVDAIIAKKNLGTTILDAECVIALGPGFTGGKDCHAVVETMRGNTLGKPIYDGNPIPNTGVPGMVGGYAKERLIQASADGIMKGMVSFGDGVNKGDIIAYTGGEPVYAQIDGIIRGMLKDGLMVEKGMKIGDVDPRQNQDLVYRISDKSWKIGYGVLEAIHKRFYENYAFVLLAAGQSKRYGKNKLLDQIADKPMFQHLAEKINRFQDCVRICVSRFPEVERYAEENGMLYVENQNPELGIAHSLTLGLKKCMERNKELQGIVFAVADQPQISDKTIEMILGCARMHPGKIICAGSVGKSGNPVCMDRKFFGELLKLKGDVGGKQVVKQHKNEVILCEIPEKELMDIDFQKMLDI